MARLWNSLYYFQLSAYLFLALFVIQGARLSYSSLSLSGLIASWSIYGVHTVSYLIVLAAAAYIRYRTPKGLRGTYFSLLLPFGLTVLCETQFEANFLPYFVSFLFDPKYILWWIFNMQFLWYTVIAFALGFAVMFTLKRFLVVIGSHEVFLLAWAFLLDFKDTSNPIYRQDVFLNAVNIAHWGLFMVLGVLMVKYK